MLIDDFLAFIAIIPVIMPAIAQVIIPVIEQVRIRFIEQVIDTVKIYCKRLYLFSEIQMNKIEHQLSKMDHRYLGLHSCLVLMLTSIIIIFSAVVQFSTTESIPGSNIFHWLATIISLTPVVIYLYIDVKKSQTNIE